ncbi:MAG: hypothetical protein ABIG96_04050 [Candidatus Micrarchaeota archaeon]
MEFEQKFNELMKRKVEVHPRLASLEKAALYDFNGTLVEMKGTGGIYERKIREMLEPMNQNASDRKIAKYVLNKVKSPKRGTKAREVYYDFLELAIERGEVKMVAFPDVFKKGNAIENDRKAGLKIISFSRGTDALMKKSMEASGTTRIIGKMYSSIPYGGEKTAACYSGFFLDLLKERKLIVKSYEDEWQNVREMLIADLALAVLLKMQSLPFQIIWVDRKNEIMGERVAAEFKHTEAAYEAIRKKYGIGTGFGTAVQRKRSLLLR